MPGIVDVEEPMITVEDAAAEQSAPDAPSQAPMAAARPTWRTSVVRHRTAAVTLDALLTGTIVAVLTVAESSWGRALALATLGAALLPLVVAARNGYSMTDVSLWRRHVRIMLEILAVFAVVMTVAGHVGPGTPAVAGVLEVVLLVAVATTAARVTQQLVAQAQRSRGRHLRRTLLVGAPVHFESLLAEPRASRAYGLDIVGLCTSHPGALPPVPMLGDPGAVPMLVAEHGVDVVLVCSDGMTATEVRELCWDLERSPVELMITAKLTEVVRSRVRLESVARSPLLHVSLRPPTRQRWSKTAFDRAVGILLLLVAAPVLVATSLAVRLGSPGPAIFTQTRVSMGGAPFTMYKLRTMYSDAEERLAELLAHNEGNGLLFKLRDDPRVTPLGRWLRRLSLDELPQLWNVVRGDMSLVGPRPALPSEVAQYDSTTRRRLRVKPGLTGLWQVSGRSDLTVEQSVRLDLRYSDNWSIGMDLVILWRTVRAVLGGRGAY